MSYAIPAGSPRAATAAAFGRELVKAMAKRDIPRNELHRVTGIGRTALDNYRAGANLPKTEAAAALASVLEWPKLAELVTAARTHPCRRCGGSFVNEGGNQGAKRYCSVDCRAIAERERQAQTRNRQAGQTNDGRRRYQALALLRSGIRIAEERSQTLVAAIAAMCASCEPEGLCRTEDCPLRAFSPLPLQRHGTGHAATRPALIRDRAARRWTPAARAAHGAITARLHATGRIPYGRNHPANDPARRESWLAACRAGKARQHGSAA